MPEIEVWSAGRRSEGKVFLDVDPTGGDRGPGVRGGVFYNPAMVNNRDLSIILVDTLFENGQLPGRSISILDGLCGSGIRALRFARELSCSREVAIKGIDIDEASIRTAREGCITNGVEVDFQVDELNGHLIRNRHSYVDVDPFGSPAPFIRNAISSLLNGGVLAVTATDTAALTGSLPRVARRRYDTQLHRTDFQHELSCRALLGNLTRTAASLERSVSPLFFYTSDHFVRGYVKLGRGAGRTDGSLKNVGYILLDDNGRVEVIHRLEDITAVDGSPKVLGPLWVGPLEDRNLVTGMLSAMEGERFAYMRTHKRIKSMLETAQSENGLPPGGYDTNAVASELRMSPPRISSLMEALKAKGFGVSRSRFSPTLVKTDTPWKVFKRTFIDIAEGE